MAYTFGDGFDLYAAIADAVVGYWDSGTTTNSTLVAGRFAGGQAWSTGANNSIIALTKSSGANDAVHHLVMAFRQNVALTGTNLGCNLQLLDGTTAQCSIVFRSDGAVLLTSGTPAGAVLATYTGAVTAQNTWTAFEFEVIISNTVGRFRARKNGNASDDYDSGATLNTRPGANTYANKLQFSSGPTQISIGANQQVIDDLLWRSDAASVPFVGDTRAYTRMPASDVQAQFSRNTGATNFSAVDEPQQNGATDYVFSATAGQSDLYGIAALAATPASVVAVTTRGFVQKSDAGTRNGAIQLKSGSTTVQSTSTALSTSWGWLWRTDATDPATGSAWVPVAVSNVNIGPVVTA